MIQRNYNHPTLVAGPGEDRGHRWTGPPWYVLLPLRALLAAAGAWLGYLTVLYPVSPAGLFLLLVAVALWGTIEKD